MSTSKSFFTVNQCCCPRGKSLSLDLKSLSMSSNPTSLLTSLLYVYVHVIRAVHEQDVLGLLHLLPSGQHGSWSARSHQAVPQLLPVGSHLSPHPGIPLLPAERLLAAVQRAVRHQRAQPRRGGRHDPERAVPGAPRQDHQVHDQTS